MAGAPSEAISVERCCGLLGRDADGLSTEKIVAVRDHADAIARMLVERWLERQSRSSGKDDDIGTVR